MDYNLLVLSLYLIVILVLLYKTIKDKRNNGYISIFVLLSYTISGIFSIIYYSVDYFNRIQNVHFLNVIYWLLVFYISLHPILQFDKQRIIKIKYNIKILNRICIIGFFISIIPFCEYITKINLLFSNVNLAETISEIHNDNEKQLQLSIVSSWLIKILNYFYYIILLSLIPVLTNNKPNKLAISGIIIVNLTKIMPGIILSSRPPMVNSIILLFIVILLFYSFLSIKDKLSIKRLTYFFLFFFGGSLAIITIYRQISYMLVDNESNFLYFISRYLGEGICNFSQYMSEIKEYTNGDKCFWYIKDVLGMKPLEMTREMSYYLESKLGYPGNEFYTYIGSFVQDIGYIGTLLFWSILSFFISRIISCRKGIITLSSFYVILIYSHILIYGTMFYTYQWDGSIALKAVIVGFLILKIFKM